MARASPASVTRPKQFSSTKKEFLLVICFYPLVFSVVADFIFGGPTKVFSASNFFSLKNQRKTQVYENMMIVLGQISIGVKDL